MKKTSFFLESNSTKHYCHFTCPKKVPKELFTFFLKKKMYLQHLYKDTVFVLKTAGRALPAPLS